MHVALRRTTFAAGLLGGQQAEERDHGSRRELALLACASRGSTRCHRRTYRRAYRRQTFRARDLVASSPTATTPLHRRTVALLRHRCTARALALRSANTISLQHGLPALQHVGSPALRTRASGAEAVLGVRQALAATLETAPTTKHTHQSTTLAARSGTTRALKKLERHVYASARTNQPMRSQLLTRAVRQDWAQGGSASGASDEHRVHRSFGTSPRPVSLVQRKTAFRIPRPHPLPKCGADDDAHEVSHVSQHLRKGTAPLRGLPCVATPTERHGNTSFRGYTAVRSGIFASHVKITHPPRESDTPATSPSPGHAQLSARPSKDACVGAFKHDCPSDCRVTCIAAASCCVRAHHSLHSTTATRAAFGQKPGRWPLRTPLHTVPRLSLQPSVRTPRKSPLETNPSLAHALAPLEQHCNTTSHPGTKNATAESIRTREHYTFGRPFRKHTRLPVPSRNRDEPRLPGPSKSDALSCKRATHGHPAH